MNKPKYKVTIISNSSGISEITLTDIETGASVKQVGEDHLVKMYLNRLKLEERLKKKINEQT